MIKIFRFFFNLIKNKMGQSSSDMLAKYNNKILTLEEFEEMINENKKLLHNQIVKSNIYPKIFICEKETDEDKLDPVYIENCEIDDIVDDYKNRCFVAQLTSKRDPNAYFESVGNIIWNDYHQLYSYGIDIYEYHKIDKTFTTFLENYLICDIKTRNGTHMCDDYVKICNTIKNLDGKKIGDELCKRFREKSRLREIDNINKKYGMH